MGCPQAKTCTIVLRGGAEQFLEETERSLHDAIMIVRRALKHDAVVAGECEGGSLPSSFSLFAIIIFVSVMFCIAFIITCLVGGRSFLQSLFSFIIIIAYLCFCLSYFFLYHFRKRCCDCLCFFYHLYHTEFPSVVNAQLFQPHESNTYFPLSSQGL